jgi:hypothetical protein
MELLHGYRDLFPEPIRRNNRAISPECVPAVTMRI